MLPLSSFCTIIYSFLCRIFKWWKMQWPGAVQKLLKYWSKEPCHPSLARAPALGCSDHVMTLLVDIPNMLWNLPDPCNFHYLYPYLGSEKSPFNKPKEPNTIPLTIRPTKNLGTPNHGTPNPGKSSGRKYNKGVRRKLWEICCQGSLWQNRNLGQDQVRSNEEVHRKLWEICGNFSCC